MHANEPEMAKKWEKEEESVEEAKKRDYKAEYKKYGSSKKAKKYRAELNKYNRQKGTYGNGDKKDASHKGGKIVGFEEQSKNRGRAEKSRLKKEHTVKFTKDEMAKLHKDGKIEKADNHGKLHTYLFSEGKLTEDYKNSEWEVYLKDEKGREKIVKKAKSKRAATILYNKIIKSDAYYEVGMRAIKESVNEDGHTDVASSKRKVMIMVDDSNKLLNKLNGMNTEDSLPSWWTDKITLSQNYLAKATDYITNPVESIKEFRNKREADTAIDQIGNKALYMIGAKDFVFGKSDGKNSLVFKIMRNSKGVSHIRMRLSSMDLYDMDFLAIRAGKIKIKSKVKGVYGDQLGAMIKKNTGLNIRL